MSEDEGQVPASDSVIVGIGPRGIMIQVKEGDVTASHYLDIEGAYAHQGHVLAAAITLEQSAYVQQRMKQQEAADILRKIKSTKPGEKPWIP
jgi:hypothetical protein